MAITRRLASRSVVRYFPWRQRQRNGIGLGCFYNEFLGIHENYDRYNQFTEREILPRLFEGLDAFYGADGKLLPIIRVHLKLEPEFSADLRRRGKDSHALRLRLEALSAYSSLIGGDARRGIYAANATEIVGRRLVEPPLVSNVEFRPKCQPTRVTSSIRE